MSNDPTPDPVVEPTAADPSAPADAMATADAISVPEAGAVVAPPVAEPAEGQDAAAPTPGTQTDMAAPLAPVVEWREARISPPSSSADASCGWR